MSKRICTVVGLEELTSLCGFMAPAVYLVALCLDHYLLESLWSELTVLRISQTTLHQLAQRLLVERVELKW